LDRSPTRDFSSIAQSSTQRIAFDVPANYEEVFVVLNRKALVPLLINVPLTMLKQIAHCEVANRPGWLEPHVLKRRRHGYKLMVKPRNELRRELRKHGT
jgi:hypothetical protein